MALDPLDVVRRLAYIRYLHGMGVEQSSLPDPMASASLLLFHDAVESFLLLAAEHLGAPATHEFEKYWDALRPSKLPNGVDLPVQQGMKRLNRQRVALKHHGSQPNQATIALIRNDTGTFLAAASLLVFDQDYDAVSMSSIIPQEATRSLAIQADAANASGDYVTAMIALVDAWEDLFDPRSALGASLDSSPLSFGPSIPRPLSGPAIASLLYSEESSRRHPRRNDELGEQIAAVTDAVLALQSAARLTAIGLEYAQFLRFKSLTPRRINFWGGRRIYRAPDPYTPTADHVAFCTQFLVTAALRVAAAEAQIETPPWIDTSIGAWHREWQDITISDEEFSDDG